MPFLSNLFPNLRVSAPVSNTSSQPSDSDTQLDSDWVGILPQDVAGYYDDRIMFILGPDKAIRYLLDADIPSSSGLLAQLDKLFPGVRCIGPLPDLDANMFDLYMRFHSADTLAAQFSWTEVIKLFVTADRFDDPVVKTTALAALMKKGKAADSRWDSMYSSADYELAKKHEMTTINSKLLATLDEISPAFSSEAHMPPMLLLPWAPPFPLSNPRVRNHTPPMQQVRSKYGNSVLRGQGLIGLKKHGTEEKEHPVRQPMIPPSVEALRWGTIGNFVWVGRV